MRDSFTTFTENLQGFLSIGWVLSQWPDSDKDLLGVVCCIQHEVYKGRCWFLHLGHSTNLMRSGWGNWECLAWRKGVSEESWKDFVARRGCYLILTNKWQGKRMAPGCTRGSLDVILGKTSSLERWSGFTEWAARGSGATTVPENVQKDTDLALGDTVWCWGWQCWAQGWTQLQALCSCVPHGRGPGGCCSAALLQVCWWQQENFPMIFEGIDCSLHLPTPSSAECDRLEKQYFSQTESSILAWKTLWIKKRTLFSVVGFISEPPCTY